MRLQLACPLLILAFAACSTAKKAEPPLTEVPPASAPAAAATDHIEAAAQTHAEKQAVAETPSAQKVTEALSAAKTEPPPPHKTEKKENSVPAKQSLLWLEHGNQRFVKSHLRRDGQSRKDIARLVTGQKPHAIVLSCSDSRVPPELVFDQKLGEIFTVRTAGESLDANVIGSIEYALLHLGAKLIVVMGHTYCGAVNAAIQTVNGGSAGTEALTALVADIRPRIKPALAKGAPSQDAARESWANAQGIADELKSRSAVIREAVEHEGVVIRSALYYLNSGEVKFQ